MTPLTISSPSRLLPLENDNPAELAIVPLSFTAQRLCTNKKTMAAIIDVLSDKSSSDQTTAAIFRNAFKHNYCADLNQIITNINAMHGPGTVLINKNVVAMLAEQSIDLIQNNDGSVQMCRPILARSTPFRHEAIRLGADPALGADVQKLICSYDDEIVICPKNRKVILSILSSNDATGKSLLFAAASHQHKIPFLNDLLSEKNITLDLSGTDLSNLDLTWLRLINANLRHANLRGATLTKAIFYGADLRNADLTNANLSEVSLKSADLSNARLLCARLENADLTDANLSNAVLLCADMRGADLETASRVNGALFNFANMEYSNFIDASAKLTFLMKNINCETTDLSAPFVCQYEHQADSEDLFEQAINQRVPGRLILNPSEKNLLLAHGVSTSEQEDGTVRLHRIVVAKPDVRRHEIINRTLEKRGIPKEPAELIAAYDDDIEICEANRKVITDILISTDQLAKGQLIAAASRQHNIAVLNEIFKALRFRAITVNLSGVDLSNLDLSSINLSSFNLRAANFHRSCLKQAAMNCALLSHAALNAADLTEAELNRADLSHARLIAAHLIKTRLRGANLHRTVLIGATLESPGLYGQLLESVSPFLQIKHNDFPRGCTLPHLNGPLTVSIFSTSDENAQATSREFHEPGIIPITSAEKQLLAERGYSLDDNHNDTFQVSKPPLMYKDPGRAQLIDTALAGTLPSQLTGIISDYDVEIDISDANEAALLDILRSGNQEAKAELIAAAIHQLQIPFLNTLFQKIKWEKIRLDLSHVDLSDLDLQGINLCDANMTGAILNGANLVKATLHRTQLVGANLNGARLESAEFYNADLTDALMIRADLSHAVFIGATLRRAVMKFATMPAADFRGAADLTDAILDHANLNDANFGSANLTNASLVHASMHETRFDTTNLTRASLIYADLVHCSLVASNLTFADLSHARLDRVSFAHNPTLNKAKWTGASFHQIRSDQQSKKAMPLRMWIYCT